MGRDAIDLFCGCGGLTLGLTTGGFDVVAGVDNNKPAMEVYRANFPAHEGIDFDLGDEDGAVELVRKFNPFLIAGGPPCQDFSIAGKKKEGDNADLTIKYASVIARTQPTAFIMENVPRAELSGVYKQARQIFRAAGYGISMNVLEASEFGVPQFRKRLIMVGMLGETDGFLDVDMIHGPRQERVSVKQFLGDEMPADFYYRHPRTYGRRAIYSVNEPSPTIRGVNRPLPGTYRKHPDDAADPGRDTQPLTPYQRSRIQTFPRSYIWPEDLPKASLELMIGNAVPVRMAAYVAERLYGYVERKMPLEPEFQPVMELTPDIDEVIGLEDKFFKMAAE